MTDPSPGPARPGAHPRWRIGLQIILVAAVTIGLIYALRHLDLATLAAALRTADPGLLVVAGAANLASQITRAVGWNVLLPTPIRFRRLVRYEFAVQAASAVSPEGSGELIRVGYLRSEGVPATTTVSLMAARKLLSSVGLVPLILLAAASIAASATPTVPGWAAAVFIIYAAVMIILLVVVVAIAPASATGPSVADPERTGKPSSRRERLAHIVSTARAALEPLRDRHALGQCLAAAVATRTLDLLGGVAVVASLGAGLPLWRIVLVLVLIELSNVLPSAPAQLGTFEAAVLLGVAGVLLPPQAVAFALLFHAQQMLPQVLAGLAAMVHPHRHQPEQAR